MSQIQNSSFSNMFNFDLFSKADSQDFLKDLLEELKEACKVELKFKRVSDTAKPPTQGTDKASCFDLYVDWIRADGDARVNGAMHYKVGFGVALDIPEGYDVKLYPRSSLFKNHASIMTNGVGVIDEDYRGELMGSFICFNDDKFPKPGDRIAQMQLQAKKPTLLTEVRSLSDTERGAGGFGSTGKS